MKELLSEIESKESERRENAWHYEKLVGERTRLTKSIQRLTEMSDAADVKALTQMHKLCADVPKDLITKGSRTLPGGFVARDLLQAVVVDALADVQRKAAAAKAALKTARQQLASVEEALKEFEQSE
jgi:hypothetical protein